MKLLVAFAAALAVAALGVRADEPDNCRSGEPTESYTLDASLPVINTGAEDGSACAGYTWKTVQTAGHTGAGAIQLSDSTGSTAPCGNTRCSEDDRCMTNDGPVVCYLFKAQQAGNYKVSARATNVASDPGRTDSFFLAIGSSLEEARKGDFYTVTPNTNPDGEFEDFGQGARNENAVGGRNSPVKDDITFFVKGNCNPQYLCVFPREEGTTIDSFTLQRVDQQMQTDVSCGITSTERDAFVFQDAKEEPAGVPMGCEWEMVERMDGDGGSTGGGFVQVPNGPSCGTGCAAGEGGCENTQRPHVCYDVFVEEGGCYHITVRAAAETVGDDSFAVTMGNDIDDALGGDYYAVATQSNNMFDEYAQGAKNDFAAASGTGANVDDILFGNVKGNCHRQVVCFLPRENGIKIDGFSMEREPLLTPSCGEPEPWIEQ